MATIIKHQTPAATPDDSGASVDVVARSRTYLDGVRTEAARIHAAAHAEAHRIRARAQEEGFRAGLTAAEDHIREQTSARAEMILPALRAAAENLEAARHSWIEEWQRQGLRIAAAIAERIVRRELSSHPEIALDTVRETFELAAGRGELRLLVHPADHDAFADDLRRLARDVARAVALEIVADASITRGGCRVELRQGTIDQTIETQLRRIAEEIL